ncbi:putative leucine-rich repeat-containing protein, partial [Trifolium medium]|nr:putative leucine-rich repeat-containing protein [Trifolium medium]
DDHDLVVSNEKVKEIINRKKSSPRYQEFERANGRQTLKDHKLATSNKIKPEKIEQILSRNSQEACDRASGQLNVLNGAEQKRFSMFVEQELLPPTTLYNSSGGGDLQEPAKDLVSTD